MEKIPICDGDLTSDYLNNVLKGFKKISQVEIKQPRTHGMMSYVRKLFLTYDDTADLLCPPTLIAKYSRAAADNVCNENMSDIMRNGCLYKREVMLNNYLNKRDVVPVIYYADCNSEQNIILLMEDCSSESDVKVDDVNVVQKCMSIDEAFIAIKDLAAFQSEFYHKNQKMSGNGILVGNDDTVMKEKGLEWIPEYFSFVYYTTFHEEFITSANQDQFAEYTNDALKRLSKSVQDVWIECCDYIITQIDFSSMAKYAKYGIQSKAMAIKESKTTVEENWYNAYKTLIEEAPLTIAHCDFRYDNVLIHNNQMKLVDWQCASLGCGMIDVMSLLSNSLDVVDVVENEEKILETYADVLHQSGVSWLTLTELKKYYACALWYEFKNSLAFVKFMKGQHEKISGVSSEALEVMMLRKVAVSILSIHKYFYA